MNASRIRRIENLTRLIAALAERSMGPNDVVGILGVADRAARNYLNDLKLAGIGRSDPDRPGHLRLNAEPAAIHVFLEEISRDATACACRALRKARRDPLVSALFGQANG